MTAHITLQSVSIVANYQYLEEFKPLLISKVYFNSYKVLHI